MCGNYRLQQVILKGGLIFKKMNYYKLELSEFKPRLSTTWEHGQDMPFTSDYHPTIAVLKGKVYVGGGGNVMMGHYVTVYDIEKDSWTIMPPYNFYWFSLAILNNQLVLVGGVGQAGQRTNTLGVWEDRTQTSKWTYPLPPMSTAHSGAMVLTQRNRWLIVAGGYNEVEESPSVVEIFDVTTLEWYRGSPIYTSRSLQNVFRHHQEHIVPLGWLQCRL